MKHPITIKADGTVHWHGVETGKTKVLAMSSAPNLITLHVAGHTYWSSCYSRNYAPAEIQVHEYEEGPAPDKIFLKELFGVMRWKSRNSNWRPKQ